jgi:hypothetical protein
MCPIVFILSFPQEIVTNIQIRLKKRSDKICTAFHDNVFVKKAHILQRTSIILLFCVTVINLYAFCFFPTNQICYFDIVYIRCKLFISLRRLSKFLHRHKMSKCEFGDSGRCVQMYSSLDLSHVI